MVIGRFDGISHHGSCDWNENQFETPIRLARSLGVRRCQLTIKRTIMWSARYVSQILYIYYELSPVTYVPIKSQGQPRLVDVRKFSLAN